MTAQLVSNLVRDDNGERVPMSAERAETLTNVTQFAESLERLLLRDVKDGQLWERVAEQKSERSLSRKAWTLRYDMRDNTRRVKLIREGYPTHPRGVIRAGVWL